MPVSRDVVWLDVLPSMKGFGPALVQDGQREADKAGTAVGKKYGTALLAGVAVVAGGAALAAKGLYSIGETFDEMADTIRVGTGAVGGDLDALVASAKNVGREVPADFDQIGVAIADVNTRLGHTGKPLETISSQFLELSRITGTDLATNIEKGSRVFGAFNIEAEDQSAALDHLFKVSQSTGIGFDDLASKATKFAAPMKQLGFSFEESTVLLGSFEKAGVNGDKVMAGLSASLGRMAKSGKDPQKEFQRLTEDIKNAGSQAEANAIAVELFGSRAGPEMATAIREGRMSVDELQASIAGSEETILSASEDTMDFSEQWKLFKNEVMLYVEPAATALFSALATGMTWIREDGIPIVKSFVGWLEDNKATLIALGITVGLAVVAFGGMAIVATVTGWLKSARTAVLALNAAMKANPIGVVITIIGLLVAALIYLYQNNETARQIMDKAWAGIKGAIDAVVGWFRDKAWPWMRDTFDKLIDKARTGKEKITGAWDSIKSGISEGWETIEGIFKKVRDGVDAVKNRFSNARDGIRSAWSALGGIIAKPINTVIDSVNSFLNRLQRGINKIPGVEIGGTWGSIPNIPVPSSSSGGGSGRAVTALKTGGMMPGYTPGRDVHRFYSPTAGVLELSGGEPVMRPEFGAAVGKGWVDQMNYIARTQGVAGVKRALYGTMSYSGGGVTLFGSGKRRFADGGWIPSLGDLFSAGAGTVRRIFESVMPDWGGSWAGVVVNGLIKSFDLGKIAKAIMDKALEAIGANGGGGGGVHYPGGYGQHPTGMPWGQIWNMIKSVVPNAIMTSNVRPGAVTASGIKSLHSLGRAVDWIVPGMGAAMIRAFNLVGQLMPWSQHFYTPAGARAQHGYVDANIRRDHYDHGHTALRYGGVFTADSGALLAPGLNLLNNQTGGPEPLGRLDRELDLSGDTMGEFRGIFRDAFAEAIRTYQLSRRQMGDDD